MQHGRGWRALRPLLHVGSLASGVLHFYWWLLVPPVVMGAITFAGVLAIPEDLRTKMRSRRAGWTMGPLGAASAAFFWMIPTLAVFAIGWALRLGVDIAMPSIAA